MVGVRIRSQRQLQRTFNFNFTSKLNTTFNLVGVSNQGRSLSAGNIPGLKHPPRVSDGCSLKPFGHINPLIFEAQVEKLRTHAKYSEKVLGKGSPNTTLFIIVCTNEYKAEISCTDGHYYVCYCSLSLHQVSRCLCTNICQLVDPQNRNICTCTNEYQQS